MIDRGSLLQLSLNLLFFYLYFIRENSVKIIWRRRLIKEMAVKKSDQQPRKISVILTTAKKVNVMTIYRQGAASTGIASFNFDVCVNACVNFF